MCFEEMIKMKQNKDNKIKKGNINDSDLSWTFLDGSRRKAVILDSVTIGKGEYLPGWKWSKHVGKITDKKSEAHIGYVISGEMMIRDSKGNEVKVGPGEAFEVKPDHDAWVIGNVPCIAIDFQNINKIDFSKENY